jgi:DNA-binding LacI/PurR family transcriptional regulator
MQNVAAARAATTHLIESGRRRIVALGAHENGDVGSAALRMRGYREALEAAGIAYDERLVSYSGPWRRANGNAAMCRVLESGVDFDAVFALNDSLGLGAIRALQVQGLSIPGDVAVIGFDDVDESRYSVPSLSSIDPGRDEIARTAVEVLKGRIEGSLLAPPTLHEAGFSVTSRESTAP